MRNKIKLELQYADYGEYEYPEPIVFWYGKQEYTQNQPYLANFPEKRVLTKFTRMLGTKTAVSAKYQYSDIREDVKQNMGELKLTRSFGESIIGLMGIQMTRDSRGFNMFLPGIGARWDISPLTILQGDIQYYYRGDEAEALGGRMESLNLRLKIRQVMTVSTAMLFEYLFYDASGEDLHFTSHTGSVWVSQFLPTQTAVHFNFRYYFNSLEIESYAPSLEIAQYIDWATVLRLKYRYYWNESSNVSLGEQEVIIPDNLKSHAFSVQINREMTPDLDVYGKYRYYKSNLDIQMNTYLFGFIVSF
jgi:hypothetical protein